MTMTNDMVQKSQFLALILRHDPDCVGVSMDEHGWVDVDELIAGMQDSEPDMTHELLCEIVENDNKQRYSFSDDGRLIRANQGHSIPIDLELPAIEPLEVLYHGTATRFLQSIREKGLLPMSRMYVHLSPDIPTASLVGERHGKLAILEVDAKTMHDDGYEFYLSDNGVWLTNTVPPEYLSEVEI